MEDRTLSGRYFSVMTASLARGFDLDPLGGLPALVVLVLDLDLATLAEVREAAGYGRLLELAAVQPDPGPLGYRDGAISVTSPWKPSYLGYIGLS